MGGMRKDLIPVIISSLITIIFFLLPVGISVKKSFFTFGGEFVGLDNYIMTFESKPFQEALIYTSKITVISILIIMVSSVILAMAIRRTFIGKKLTLFLLQFDVAMPSITCASMMLIVMSQTGSSEKQPALSDGCSALRQKPQEVADDAHTASPAHRRP